jgi:D-alanyl-D-alanine carboxypeptidase (penicillin-binding protein 5/6)
MEGRSVRATATLSAAIALLAVAAGTAPIAEARISKMARTPYVGAIVIEAKTGTVLFQDAADRRTYPASVLKMMTLLITLEQIDRGAIHRSDRVRVTREAELTNGSQAYLREGEVLTVDDLMYALMIQSANDAAVMLATHIAGSKPAFVRLMNARAQQLGMRSTLFSSPHGLPPTAKGQDPDVTTARDIATLARALLKHEDVVRYTSTRQHAIRDGRFVMRSHNHLLDRVKGCDGLKTGFFSAAGFSIAATAVRDGVRVIVVVLGSSSSGVRDRKAAELLEIGLSRAPAVLAAAQRPAAKPVNPVARPVAKPLVKPVPRPLARR